MPHVASWAYNKDMAIELRPRHVSRDVCRNQSAQTKSKIIKNNPRMHTHMREKGKEMKRGLLLPPSWSRETAIDAAS